VFNWHHAVYFGRHEEGVLESEFSGNLVEVCPTGVFTDKTLMRHYTRKWDLQTAPSVCVHCGLGCNTLPEERYGTLRRIRNRYNGAVNGFFICDRGRFGYEFVNCNRRIRKPLVRGSAAGDVLHRAAELVRDRERVVGIGSPRASLEANFALRQLVGPERFFSGMSDTDSRLVAAMIDILRSGPARTPSLREVEQCDAVLILGEDVTNCAPMLALALRQSALQKPKEEARKLGIHEWDDGPIREVIQDERGPFYIATPAATKLDDVATKVYRATGDDVARLGFAVAYAIDSSAPGPGDMPLAAEIAAALKGATRPWSVSGAGLASDAVIHAATNVARALCRAGKPAQIVYTVSECNSVGLAMMGGHDLSAAFAAVEEGKADTIVILENDLYRRADAASVDAFLAAAKHVIVLDHLASATTAKAEVVLPAAAFAESDGTLVNNECRAQRFFRVYVPQPEIRESWRWLAEMSGAKVKTFDDMLAAVAAAMPELKAVTELAPHADFRMFGQKVPRQPHRMSGRTAETADVTVHEPQPPDDPDSPLAFTMEGREAPPPPALLAHYWWPGWNSVQALNKFQQEISGPLRGGDPGRRLIEPDAGSNAAYFADVPPRFERRADEWLIQPLYHIFGSEELSACAQAVAELTPRPYLALNFEDAKRLGLVEHHAAEVVLNGEPQRLPVRFVPTLASGVAGRPVGLANPPGPVSCEWVKISKASQP
jgi:NADH-quinone oxidoreductase subunit G